MIGSVSSGIHAVLAILPDVISMDHYVHEMNLLGGAFGRDDFESESKRKSENFAYTECEKMLWSTIEQSMIT